MISLPAGSGQVLHRQQNRIFHVEPDAVAESGPSEIASDAGFPSRGQPFDDRRVLRHQRRKQKSRNVGAIQQLLGLIRRMAVMVEENNVQDKIILPRRIREIFERILVVEPVRRLLRVQQVQRRHDRRDHARRDRRFRRRGRLGHKSADPVAPIDEPARHQIEVDLMHGRARRVEPVGHLLFGRNPFAGPETRQDLAQQMLFEQFRFRAVFHSVFSCRRQAA